MIAEETSTTLSMNHKKLNERMIEMERNMHRLEQYSRRECIEIASVPNRITNDLLGEHVTLIFERLGVVIEAVDIVACQRLGETGRIIVKLLKREDAQTVLEEKHKREVSIFMMITAIPAIKEKSSLTKAFTHTIGNFMIW